MRTIGDPDCQRPGKLSFTVLYTVPCLHLHNNNNNKFLLLFNDYFSHLCRLTHADT